MPQIKEHMQNVLRLAPDFSTHLAHTEVSITAFAREAGVAEVIFTS